MKSFRFAARALVRQPGRAALGIAGIAGVGALLFDMLLLSNGLVVSFRRLLDSLGYEVRVTATDAMAGMGPRLADAASAVRTIRALPDVAEVVAVRMISAEAITKQFPVPFELIGSDPPGTGASPRGALGPPWTIVEGQDLPSAGGTRAASLVVNRRFADGLEVGVGDTIAVRGTCTTDRSALPPIAFVIAGIADFPFDDGSSLTAAARFADVGRTCGDERQDEADMLLVATREGARPEDVVAAIRRADPALHAFTNEQLVGRVQEAGLSYFRQISTVVATVTLFFGFLLITVLLTVSVNQRLGEIATLRALGFSARRIAADVLWQSAILVGAGGLLALPLGVALAAWLDTILRAMPNIPATLNFFEYDHRALVLHVVLLAVTAVAAAAYPVRLVATLPIAATLRSEVVS